MAYADQLAGAVTDHHEVECEPAERALSGQPFADGDGRLADQPRIGGIGGEDAAEVALPAGTAQQLIMSGQQFQTPIWKYPELDARAEQLLTDDPLLDDPAVLLELRLVRGQRGGG